MAALFNTTLIANSFTGDLPQENNVAIYDNIYPLIEYVGSGRLFVDSIEYPGRLTYSPDADARLPFQRSNYRNFFHMLPRDCLLSLRSPEMHINLWEIWCVNMIYWDLQCGVCAWKHHKTPNGIIWHPSLLSQSECCNQTKCVWPLREVSQRCFFRQALICTYLYVYIYK